MLGLLQDINSSSSCVLILRRLVSDLTDLSRIKKTHPFLNGVVYMHFHFSGKIFTSMKIEYIESCFSSLYLKIEKAVCIYVYISSWRGRNRC